METLPKRKPDFVVNLYGHNLNGWKQDKHFAVQLKMKDDKELIFASYNDLSQQKERGSIEVSIFKALLKEYTF